jgi:hypothetical protein
MNILFASMILLLGTTALQPPGVHPATSVVPGISTKGLAVALVGPTQPVHPGDTIAVTVEIRNVTGGPLYVIYRGRVTGYKFRVVDQSSNKTLELRTEGKPGLYEMFSGSSSGTELPAGASYFIDLRLDDYVDLVKSGTYRVTVKASIFLVNHERTGSEVLTLQPSNPITITVVP